MQEWDDAGVWLDLWRRFLGEFDKEGILSSQETFSDATFSPAIKRDVDVGKTKRGKGTKHMVADGRGAPLGVRIAPASPAEVTLIESILEQVALPRSGPGRLRTKPRRLNYNKAADSDALRVRLKKRAIELICPHRWNRQKAHAPKCSFAATLPPLLDDRNEYGLAWTLRRLVVWYERKSKLFPDFLRFACLLITIRRL